MAEGWNIFGFEIKRKSEDAEQERQKTFTPPDNDDGALVIQRGAYYGTTLNMEATYKNEIDLINKYRKMAIQPEMETAIDEIINDAVVPDETGLCVSVNLDNLEVADNVKKKITDEFKYVLRVLNFSNQGYELFKRWYVDGRIFFHAIIDKDKPKDGIKELRYIDPRKLRKIREIIREKDRISGIDLIRKINEYYLYNEMGMVGAAYSNLGVRISVDSVISATSGLMDVDRRVILSYLHKSIKPLNSLRLVEDSLVIYRLTRAPERRAFYIDVGSLPTKAAMKHLQTVKDMYRDKIVYDADTGEIRNDRKFMAMTEDFWLPRREGSNSTEIDTLPGADNLGNIEDIIYFERKLFKSLGVPLSRLEATTGFSLGRANEINRDEIKFSKYIKRLQKRFSDIFDAALKIQLVLKGVCSEEDWDQIRHDVSYEFRVDNYYDELKEMEMWTERVTLATSFMQFRGQLVPKEWIRKKILRFTDEDIKEMDSQMEKEKESGEMDDDIDTNLKIAGATPTDGSIEQQSKLTFDQTSAQVAATPPPPEPEPAAAKGKTAKK